MLNILALNSSCFSLKTGKIRSMAASSVLAAGPHNVSSPQFPIVPVVGSEKSETLYHSEGVPIFFGALQFANCVEPDALSVVLDPVTVNGEPVRSEVTVSSFQFPRICAGTPLVAHD